MILPSRQHLVAKGVKEMMMFDVVSIKSRHCGAAVLLFKNHSVMHVLKGKMEKNWEKVWKKCFGMEDINY